MERRAGAVDNTGKDITAEIVGPEPVLRGWWRKASGHVLDDRIVSRQEWRGERNKDQKDNDCQPCQAERVKAKFQPALMELLRARLKPALGFGRVQPFAKAATVDVVGLFCGHRHRRHRVLGSRMR
jgi:hypothetical protein